MATVQQLKDAVYATLESNGSLNAIKARIRADIYTALDSQSMPQQPNQPPTPPQPSNTNLLINELLRDYLTYNNLTHTLSTLLVEANQPLQPPFDRTFIMGELGIVEAEAGQGVGMGGGRGSKVPLLYGMVAAMRGDVKERREREREESGGMVGKEEVAVARGAAVGTSTVSSQQQRSSVGGGVEEKIVRATDIGHQQQQQHPPQHRVHLSS